MPSNHHSMMALVGHPPDPGPTAGFAQPAGCGGAEQCSAKPRLRPEEGGDFGSAAGAASRLEGSHGPNEDRRARINRLKWHCRRALLELDLVFDRFWERHEGDLDAQGEAALESLLELQDHELWALVSGREVTDDPQQAAMIERLREVSPLANFE